MSYRGLAFGLATVGVIGHTGQAGAADIRQPVGGQPSANRRLVLCRWNFGDGGTAAGSTAEHSYAGPGAFAVSATATDAAGNQITQNGTTGVRALRPDEIDTDRDGFASDKDCNDGNPAIHPGALEIRGNAVDENCDKVNEPFPKLTANASLVVLFGRGFTELDTLKVTGLERGDTVKLSCKGRGCRRSLEATIRIKRKTRRLDLSKRVDGVRLRKGAELQVRISHPDFITRLFRFTIKRLGEVPRRTELCQPPRAKRPGRC
jgi:hypothetical protein